MSSKSQDSYRNLGQQAGIERKYRNKWVSIAFDGQKDSKNVSQHSFNDLYRNCKDRDEIGISNLI